MMVFGVIVLVLVLLALVPVGVQIGYDERDLTVRIMAGSLGIRVFPWPKRTHKYKVAKKPRKTSKQPKQKKTEQKPSIPLGLSGIMEILNITTDFLSGFRRKLIVRKLWIRVWFGGADAAKAAISYGRAWAVIGAVSPVIENLFTVKDRDVAAELDYEKTRMELAVLLDLRMRIGTAVYLTLRGAVAFLKFYFKQKKAVQKHESSST